ncbi:hypothetical protein BVER_05404 [Candidatus Burkholderia verschuerenii]|uniref:Uncharacterized protein n=1 Tax=Candidatus Burkholderia verschuerenii TaxID=242163 RepID=A0A0L0MEF1_9BURK|nr:hypothetical protein BVER_05404 [Candidatus Burkholderia verschuerenii]
MRKLGDWRAGLILSCIVASAVRSADPAHAAHKRAALGMFVSLLSSAVFCGFAVALLPDDASPAGLESVAIVFQERAAAGFGLAASAVGICFIVCYVLVLKWPERFVDLSE